MPRRPKYAQTQKAYADLYKCSTKTIQRHVKAGHPLDDPEKMQAIFASQKNKPKSAVSGIEVDAATLTDEQLENPRNEEEAKLFERILICRKLSHALKEAKRLVIPKDEVREGEMRVNAAVKSRLLGLSGEMPVRLAGKNELEIQQILSPWVHETLTALSDARSSLYARPAR